MSSQYFQVYEVFAQGDLWFCNLRVEFPSKGGRMRSYDLLKGHGPFASEAEARKHLFHFQIDPTLLLLRHVGG